MEASKIKRISFFKKREMKIYCRTRSLAWWDVGTLNKEHKTLFEKGDRQSHVNLQ